MGKLSLTKDENPRTQDAFSGPYQTKLHPIDESAFQKYLANNQQIPGIAAFNSNDPKSDYDMRGWWQAYSNPNNPQHALTQMGESNYDGQPHFNDYWKTPYHQSFSQESKFAIPGFAGQWVDDGNKGWNLVNRRGEVEHTEPANYGSAE